MEKLRKEKMDLKDSSELKKIKLMNRLLLLVFAMMVGGTSWGLGSAAAKGTLIGCAVVAINYFFSQEFLKKLMFSDKLPIYFIIFYVAKLGGAVAIIYLSVKIGMDLIGLTIGLSSFWVTSILSVFVKRVQSS